MMLLFWLKCVSCFVAEVRGFMTHKGVPDYQRAARFILKDFVSVCMHNAL